MTRFLDKSFSVYQSGDDTYRANWEAIFGKKKPKEPEPTLDPEPPQPGPPLDSPD